MEIRNFKPGDETAQVAIYNEVAGGYPNVKPATVADVQRRTSARDFDPNTCLYAVEGDQVVGYCLFHANGRVSFPWCRPGFEACAEPLLTRALEGLRQRRVATAFSAYRADWPAVGQFFESHGFRKARDMMNFVQDIIDMPTVPARPGTPMSPLQRSDVPALFKIGAGVLRSKSAGELEKWFFENPYLSPGDVFVLRDRSREIVGAGLVVTNSEYADAHQVNSLMPCFRLGAFGTEGLQVKRIRGVFSFLARNDRNLPGLALDALSQAAIRVQMRDQITSFAAQVASDAPHLVQFYQRHFRHQGNFPVYERSP